jgi:hypothetical protein
MIRKLGLERTLQGGTGVDKRVRNLIGGQTAAAPCMA